MRVSSEAPWCLPNNELFQVLLAPNHPGGDLREFCKQPKLREPPPVPDKLQCSLRHCRAALQTQKPASMEGLSFSLQMPAREMKPQEAASGLPGKACMKDSFSGGDVGFKALQHDSSWCRGLRRGWKRDWGGERTQTWDLALFYSV